MRSVLVIPVQAVADGAAGVADRVIGFQIDLFIFDAAPHPCDEHVVTPGTLSIHRQQNVPAEYRVGEFGCGELAALIRVDDPG